MTRPLLASLVLSSLCLSASARNDLWLGRGGTWNAHVPVAVANPSDTAWEGRAVVLPVGAGEGRLPVAGARVEELRLVDGRGVQLEFGVWSADKGRMLTSGPVPEGALFSIPVCAAAHGKADYKVYFDNPRAWGLADFWKHRPFGLVNGGFERVDADGVPSGWRVSAADAQHRLSVVPGGVSGRCIHAEADAGAKASWFCYAQDGIPVTPGAVVTLRAKIRGEDVKGNASFYVHAGNDVKGDVLNNVIRGFSGTFDWKTLEATMTIPAGCRRMTVGSVLRGTGRAWYDELEVAIAEAKSAAPVVSVGKAVRPARRLIGETSDWPAAKWEYRVPVRLLNDDEADAESVLAAFPLLEALHATRHPEYEFAIDGKRVETCALGGQLMFRCSLPAKSVTTGYLYVRQGAKPAETAKREELKSALGSDIPSDQVLVERISVKGEAAFAAILSGPANLVRNGSFEDGAAGWSSNAVKGATMQIAEGGRFGGRSARLTIPKGVRPNWDGWRQTVDVKPDRSYLYGAFISGDGLETTANVHAHLHDAKGRTVQMVSAGAGVSGTAPWTPVFGMLGADSGVCRVSLQLTMNGPGTVSHDGVLLAEFRAGAVGEPEFAPAGAAEGGLRVGQVDPVVKVFRETPVADGAGRPFSVALARNETETLQLAVRSPNAVASLEAAVSLPAPLSVEVGRVGYVPVDWPTAYYNCTTPEWELRYPRAAGQSDGWSGWWPDPVEPAAAGPVEANRTQAYWIEVTAGADVKPGTYRGTVEWKDGGKVVRTDRLDVEVWDFALPERPAFPAIYDLRLGRQWEGLGDTQDARRERLWAFMARQKVCPDSLDGRVKFAKDASGRVTADFAEYDRLASRYFDHYKFPSSYTPYDFYCFGWAMPPKKFLGEDPYEGTWPYAGADWTKLRPAYKSAYQQALKLYWDHVKAKGWADRLTLYISDEPHFTRSNVVEQMKALCDMIHAVDPSIRIYSSTWRHCPDWNGSLDTWGVGHYGCFPLDELKARRAAGQRFWWTTDGQMCLDTPYCAVERLLPLYAHKYGADAYEFWGCTWLTYDPWKYGWHSYIRQSDTPGKTYWVRYPAGDGYLIYPPKDGGSEPASSIRLAAARDGVEDHAYLMLLSERAKTDSAAAALLDEWHALVAFPNAGGRYSTRILPEPEKVGEIRRRAGALLGRGKTSRH